MEEGVTEARLTWNDDKTCAISCVCNEAKGYTGTSGFNCSLHKHPCGVDRELKKGSCVPCDKGYHNADPKFGRCVPDDSKKPSTQPSSSTWKSFLDSVTETSHPTQDIPTSQDDESSNHTVPIVVVVVIAVVAIIVVVVIGCIKSGKINIACCGQAIQDSNNSDRLPNGTNHCRHNAADGSCPNGTIGGQSNISTGHQHPNGGYQTATGGQPNGFVGHSTDAHSTDARTDGTISSNGGGELSVETTWNYSLDRSGTNGESGDPNIGTSSSSTSRQSPNCSQSEYSTRALLEMIRPPNMDKTSLGMMLTLLMTLY
ncbi:uncharacterized protein LOC124285720 [Haliotis rubra]|uniref:uncharacterized protein LOC124285720 n=1 Tax=Haliotis rubra TaxID=36100 RepID=UPI001EE5EF0A|nr:uncharacterized protein LOC124285720 [Haliotis rubra]XP_046577954.1 uncharacterized protein LOC124285720 [Haliotis rubra]